jgi:hypothetical protein
MHPILVEQIAKQRTAAFDRDVDAASLVALARSATAASSPGLRERLGRRVAQVRVLVGGAPA